MPSSRPALFAAAGLLAVLAAFAGATQTAPNRLPAPPRGSAAEARFEKTVRPLLVARCVPCHSARNPQGGLRLDTPDGARKAVLPGDPVASALVRAIRYDGALKMPPSGKLPDSEIRALTAWVAEGAPWPVAAAAAPSGPHWAFVAPRRPAVPKVAGARTPVDAFVRARLQRQGIAPAAPADRRTLLRRITFDLTGLPPTPEEVDAFLADTRPDAYERVVDRLLASPAYGERWARHWLDVARYADSNGLDENLAFGYAWQYRDWVVRALNRDLPYDRFIQDQIAGDLLPAESDDARNEATIATGYLTLGPKVLAEQDKPKLVMDIVDEQIDVVSKSVIGVTIACARCHDHKFDPISTKDYYALAGIFKSTKTMANLDFVSRWNERPLVSPTLKAEQERYDTEVLAPLRAAVAAARKASEAAVASSGGLFVEATAFAQGNVGRDQYGKGSINTNATPTRVEWKVAVPKAGRYALALRYAAQESRPVKVLVNGAMACDGVAGKVTGSWQLEGQRWDDVGTVTLAAGENAVRIECGGAIPHFSRLLFLPEGAASPVASEAALRGADDALRGAEAKRPQAPVVMAVEEGKPEDVRIHVRGDTQSLGDVAPRGFPSALCGGRDERLPASAGSGRKDLALWLTRPSHPLTARVAVNRVWQHLFGQGLVSTPDNWGVRGEKPSHPELLDYLATTFVSEDRWSQKRLIRRLVLSDTYRQTSGRTDAKAAKADPENHFYWKASRRRLEAEPLRDALYFVAGTLDQTVGGSLLKTGNGDYVTNDQSNNGAQYDVPRRSLYLPVIRNAVYDFFQAFDFGDPSMVNAKRSGTTVAPQALYLLNSPLVREQSRAFARRVLRGAEGDAARLNLAYRLAFQRVPFPAEAARAFAFLARVEPLASPGSSPAARRDEAWATLCQALMASNEFTYVE